MAMDARQVIASYSDSVNVCHAWKHDQERSFDTFQLPNRTLDDCKICDEKSVALSCEMCCHLISAVLNELGPWKNDSEALKPCWNKPALEEREQSTGFITFSFSNGPEYHVSQLADAVVIARYLGATLVLPDIRKSERGQKSVVRVALDQPSQASTGKLTLQPELQEVVDSMVGRLRNLSRKSNGQFVAVDLSLDALREIFPKTFTKEGIMPAEKKAKFLSSESSEFEKAMISTYVLKAMSLYLPFPDCSTPMWSGKELLPARARYLFQHK
ncbi:Protein MANNAN synthesis-related 2 [Vitis vinifera]|uniref:Protein MANNAN synthesis-related 2 n=1 Tax=Vitis vinifera TaxID=29760 RepID=A0A438GWZ8_VITVI|nr:Protein MANNAN synthesis-related 2 [Vitis vinifera]